VALTFKGSASSAKVIAAAGALKLDVPSIRELAAWVGAPIKAPGDGLGPLNIEGKVDVKGSRYAFNDAKLSVDKITGSGQFAFDGGGRKPKITGRLDLGMLDLNPYLPPEGAKSGDAKSTGKSAPAKSARIGATIR